MFRAWTEMMGCHFNIWCWHLVAKLCIFFSCLQQTYLLIQKLIEEYEWVDFIYGHSQRNHENSSQVFIFYFFFVLYNISSKI